MKKPFKLDDFFVTEPTEVDFAALEDDQVFALVMAYGRYHPPLATLALGELVVRARRDPDVKARTVSVLEQILHQEQVAEEVFADALRHLYTLDRERGQLEIVRVIDTCGASAVSRAADALGWDIERRRGEPDFDRAIVKIVERLRLECQTGHVPTDDELVFLQKARSSAAVGVSVKDPT